MAAGRPCSICAAPARRVKVDAAIERLGSAIGAARALGMNPQTLARHAKHIGERAPGVKKAPPPPELPPTMPPKERCELHMTWLQTRIQWAQQNGASTREVAALAGQYTAAIRLHGKLTGAFDITESQIVRSAPFEKLMLLVKDALRAHPLAVADLVRVVDAYAEVRQ